MLLIGFLIILVVVLIFFIALRRRKPLLILEIDNVLLFQCNRRDNPDMVNKYRHLAGFLDGTQLIWQRPYLIPFIDRCMANYTVAIWSSAENAQDLVNFIFGKSRLGILFVWDRSHCKGIRKQISHVWQAFPEYDATNTIMLDDSVEKLCENPVGTRLLIKPWTPHMLDDCELKDLL